MLEVIGVDGAKIDDANRMGRASCKRTGTALRELPFPVALPPFKSRGFTISRQVRGLTDIHKSELATCVAAHLHFGATYC